MLRARRGNGSIPRSGQSDNFGSPSITSILNAGCSPLLHSLACALTRYFSGPPSARSLRSNGRGIQTNSVSSPSCAARTTEYPWPPISTNATCGARSRLDNSRALAASPLRAYSRPDRTPCFTNRLIPGTYKERSAWVFGKLYSWASIAPGAEIDPVTNASPTGWNGFGGSVAAASPAQKLWRSPETLANP